MFRHESRSIPDMTLSALIPWAFCHQAEMETLMTKVLPALRQRCILFSSTPCEADTGAFLLLVANILFLCDSDYGSEMSCNEQIALEYWRKYIHRMMLHEI